MNPCQIQVWILQHCILYLFQSRAKNRKMATKNCLKDKLEDDELDLSMMQLTDVPVKVGLSDLDVFQNCFIVEYI
jgi:hypothetical protein